MTRPRPEEEEQQQSLNGLAVSPPALTRHEIELVRHLARMAAERDYKLFLATGRIPYHSPDGKEN